MTSSADSFRSVAQRILDRAHADPDRVLLTAGSMRLTGAQLAHRIRRRAADLAEAGVRPDDLVALVAPVSSDAVATRYALGLLGAAIVTCPHAADPPRLTGFLRSVAPDLVLLFPETAGAEMAAADRSPAPRVLRVDQLPRAGDAAGHEIAVDPGADSVLVTSGGTTGRSKASRHSFRGWLQTVSAPPAPARRQLICTPLAYVAQVHLDQTLLAGGTVVLLPRFDAGAVLAAVETHAVTHLGLVEPMVAALAEHPEATRCDLSSLVLLAHIGADAAPSLRRRWLERLGPRLANPYGASEVGIMTILPPPDYRADRPELLDTAGRAVPGVEIQIVDEDDRAVPANTDGRIKARSAARGDGYRGGPGGESAFRSDGWYVTGDVGRLDETGYLRVRGRTGDARTVGGRTLFPVDVQDALCSDPAVTYAVALPSDTGAGFDAVVQLATDAPAPAPDALRPVVTDRFGAALHRLVVVAAVPLTEQGKPDRAGVRELLA